jgi:hypothetical protein
MHCFDEDFHHSEEYFCTLEALLSWEGIYLETIKIPPSIHTPKWEALLKHNIMNLLHSAFLDFSFFLSFFFWYSAFSDIIHKEKASFLISQDHFRISPFYLLNVKLLWMSSWLIMHFKLLNL